MLELFVSEHVLDLADRDEARIYYSELGNVEDKRLFSFVGYMYDVKGITNLLWNGCLFKLVGGFPRR